MLRGDNPRIYADGCHLEPADVDVRDECVYGDDGPLVLLAGDSHAAQWFPALETLAEDRGYRLASLTKSSCPLADFPIELFGKGREYTECLEWNEGCSGTSSGSGRLWW